MEQVIPKPGTDLKHTVNIILDELMVIHPSRYKEKVRT